MVRSKHNVTLVAMRWQSVVYIVVSYIPIASVCVARVRHVWSNVVRSSLKASLYAGLLDDGEVPLDL